MNIKRVGDVVLVELDEEYSSLDQPRMHAAQKELADVVAVGESPKVVFNMAKTRFVGSDFLEMVFRIWHRVNKRQGKFVLAGVQPWVGETLQITHLDTLWPMYPTVDEALAACR